MPVCGRRATELTIDGTQASVAEQHDGAVFIRQALAAGPHHFVLTFSSERSRGNDGGGGGRTTSGFARAERKAPTAGAEPTYSGRFVQMDNSTAGSWIGMYGKLGYQLLSFNGPAQDAIKKPSYVQSVSCTAGVAG